MKSALSTQNRQTFFLRTKLRLPRLAGPPGPLGRPPGPPGPPPPGPEGLPPPNDDPPPCPPPCDCCPPCSSAIRYLPNKIAQAWWPESIIRLTHARLRVCAPVALRPLGRRRSWRWFAADRRHRRRPGNSRNRLARPARGALIAVPLQFFLALQLFVEAHGHVLDDRVGDLQAALEFLDHFAVRRFQNHIHEVAFAQFLNAIRHALPSPLGGRFDLRAFFRGGGLERGDDLVDVRFRRIRPANKNQIILTFFHVSLDSSPAVTEIYHPTAIL